MGVLRVQGWSQGVHGTVSFTGHTLRNLLYFSATPVSKREFQVRRVVQPLPSRHGGPFGIGTQGPFLRWKHMGGGSAAPSPSRALCLSGVAHVTLSHPRRPEARPPRCEHVARLLGLHLSPGRSVSSQLCAEMRSRMSGGRSSMWHMDSQPTEAAVLLWKQHLKLLLC